PRQTKRIRSDPGDDLNGCRAARRNRDLTRIDPELWWRDRAGKDESACAMAGFSEGRLINGRRRHVDTELKTGSGWEFENGGLMAGERRSRCRWKLRKCLLRYEGL